MLRSCVAMAVLASVQVSARDDEVSLFDLELEQLMQIEVTVQRRLENILQVPIATTVLSAKQLSMLSVVGDDMRLFASRLPSFQAESSFGRTFPRFYIRGIGNTSFDIYASQPVSLLYDDVLMESPILKGFPIFDLAQMEMARGPQGTLFGRNTPAGIINLTSVRPGRSFGGYARLGLGTYQSRNFEAALGGPLGQNWSGRVSVTKQQRNDWVKNEYTGPESGFDGFRDSAFRLQLRYQGLEDFDALFKLHGRDLNGSARLFRANIIERGSNDFVEGFQPDRVAQDGRNQQDLSHLGASIHLKWVLPHFDFYAITAYETADVFSRGDIDGGFGTNSVQPSGPGFIPFDSETAAGLPRHGQFTQELRLASNSQGVLDWQAGLLWFDEGQKVENFNYSSIAGGEQNGYAVIRQDNQAIAVFASAGYSLSDHWQVRAGLRETIDRKSFTAERSQTPFGGTNLAPIKNSSDVSHLSWDLTSSWQLNEHYNTFIRVAEGFRAPSFQGRVMFSDNISYAKSETVLSLEAGLKAESADKRMRYGVTLYNYRFDSPQLTAVGGTGNTSELLNAARADGSGVEADFDTKLGRYWSLSGSVSYNDTAINDSELKVRVCGAPCTVVDPITLVSGVPLAHIDGNPLPYAPRWTMQLNVHYERPFNSGYIYMHSDWTWRSEMNFFLYESREFRADPLLEGGIAVGYTWQNGRYDVSFFARNLTDQTALVGGIDFNNLTGIVNDPRIMGIELKTTF